MLVTGCLLGSGLNRQRGQGVHRLAAGGRVRVGVLVPLCRRPWAALPASPEHTCDLAGWKFPLQRLETQDWNSGEQDCRLEKLVCFPWDAGWPPISPKAP